MKCPVCNKEFSEPILPFHIERCKKGEKDEKSKETPQEKKIEQMNKDELVAKAEELGIVIEDAKAVKKDEIIEMIKSKETPQE